MLFLFDMDNVLYDYQWRRRMDGLSEVTGHDFQELRRRWWHDAGEWAAEKGDPPTGEEYLERVNRAFERDVTRAQWLHHRRAAMTLRPDIVELAGFAATHGQVAVLTNNGALIGEHLSDTIAPELVEVFGDNLFATAHFFERKPEPTVFQRALEHLGAAAEETFFVDDIPENVRGAEQIGITGHWFPPGQPAAELRQAMDAFIAGRAPRE